MDKLKVIWSNQAVQALKDIYEYYEEKSPQGAQNVTNDLLQAPNRILFAKQYQVDEINPKYRRIVVRGYKLLYFENAGAIQIMDIVSTYQSPDKLREK